MMPVSMLRVVSAVSPRSAPGRPKPIAHDSFFSRKVSCEPLHFRLAKLCAI